MKFFADQAPLQDHSTERKLIEIEDTKSISVGNYDPSAFPINQIQYDTQHSFEKEGVLSFWRALLIILSGKGELKYKWMRLVRK